MADLANALQQLGGVLTAITDRLEGRDARDAAADRFVITSDFRPANTPAEQLLVNQTRHKHQSQYQKVDPVEAVVHPTVGDEPRRQSNVTVTTALKQIPNSAITWCNENAFDTEICNAQNNIERFKLQFPGDIVPMLLKGTYDDAARGDNSHTRRLDHIVELAQRHVPNWNSGTMKWAHHGIEYTVTRAFLDELKRRVADPNGMRGNPWSSIHPNDAHYPVSEPSIEYVDLGCFDQTRSSILRSEQTVAHNLPDPTFHETVGTTVGINAALSILNEANIALLPHDLLVPYFATGTTIVDLITLDALNMFNSVRPANELLALLHQRNTYVEGLIRILKIGIRARLPALIGKVIHGERITDATPYYNLAAEHKAQSLNSTPSTTLERDLGFVATRNQFFVSGDTPHVLEPETVKLHPFGVDVVVIQQKKKSSNAMEHTAERGSYLFSGVYGYFAHQYTTSPQTHVILQHDTGKLQVTAKVLFPYLKSAEFRAAVAPTIVSESTTDTAAAGTDTSTTALFGEKASLPTRATTASAATASTTELRALSSTDCTPGQI